MATKPQNPAVPNFPLPPTQYNTDFQNKFSNVLRLFLNQLNAVLTVLTNSYITNTTLYTVSTLPTASTSNVGTRTFVSDSSVTTFGSTVVGGGTNTVPVYSDGTSWKVG
jgi:hypothetical protein